MATLTGGQALVQSLKSEGITTIFGLPGVQLDWAFDALHEERGAIRVLNTRHEQGTAYMADGYARTTGLIGTCMVVPGPGLLNAAAGLSTAYACSSPVLCVTGQISSELIGVGRGVLHEIPEQLRMVSSVTKWAGRAMNPNEIPGIIREACRQLRTGRPRPVEVEVPPDVLQATAEVQLLDSIVVNREAGDPELLERAARALGGARRPVIFAGGGIMLAEASPELRQLAEMLEAPVLPSRNGRGALDDRHDLSASSISMPLLVGDSDVILAVGTRFEQSTSVLWPADPSRTYIQLDIDPAEIGRNLRPTIGIVGDAKLGLKALVDRVSRHNQVRPSRREELRAIKRRAEFDLDEIQPQSGFSRAIRKEVPDDGILVADFTQVGYWSYAGYPVYQPRTFVTPGYQGTLGFGFPTALGAKVGNPDRKVVSISGDGGFMFNVQELSSMVRHKINVVAVVFDDGAYGNVRRTQREAFGGHTIASELTSPDWAKLAEAFGVRGVRAETSEDLRTALREALKADEPTLIVVPVGEMPSMWRLMRGRQTPQPAKVASR